MDMRDEGFNQKIWVDWETGMIFGGNRYNCGWVLPRFSSRRNLMRAERGWIKWVPPTERATKVCLRLREMGLPSRSLAY